MEGLTLIVLDTHVLLWWLSGAQPLSAKAARLSGKNTGIEGVIAVSSISTWEIAMLVANNRLNLSMDVDSWLAEAARIPAPRSKPVDNATAIHSVRLPGQFHKDPADRMIVALARHLSLQLVTADEKILRYPHVKTVW